MKPLILSAVVAALLAVAGPATASVIVYQCGPGVCAVDPDSGQAPRTLAADGTVAGVTRDGVTASWVDPSGTLVQAPAAGGAARPAYTGGGVGNQPSMSPDGTQYLWWQIGPGIFGGLSDVYIFRARVGVDEIEGVSHCVTCTTSHGWLGAGVPIAAFPGGDGEPSEICRIDSGPGSSCVQLLASETRGGVGFPSGSPDGTRIAAALSPGERTGIRGRIVVYSATGATDVTAGPADTYPTWSAEGTRIAFDRGGEQIVVKDLTTGTERAVAAGHTPFWGGAATPARATLTAGRSRKVSAWRTLKGTLSGAAGVEVAVSRRSGKRCVAYAGTRFKRTACSRVPWTKAKVSGERWSLRLRGLAKGRYTVRVRGLDGSGRPGQASTKTLTLR